MPNTNELLNGLKIEIKKLTEEIKLLRDEINTSTLSDSNFEIISNGGSSSGDEYFALKAKDGDVELGSSTILSDGTNLQGEVIKSGDTLKGKFDSVNSTGSLTGKLYAYHTK